MVMVEERPYSNDIQTKSLDELKAYIQANPGIVIKRDAIAIPGELKTEFYHLFNKVRQDTVKDILGANLLERAWELSDNYTAIEQVICRKPGPITPGREKKVEGIKKSLSGPFAILREKLGFGNGFKFDEIILDNELRTFLSCPIEGLSRVLFEPLFGLLQEKISEDGFWKTIETEILPLFLQLYHSGYDKWVILNLFKMLKVKKFYKPESRIIDGSELLNLSRIHAEGEDTYPALADTAMLNFESEWQRCSLCTTDIVILSTAGVYIGIKSGFSAGLYNLTNSNIRPNIQFAPLIPLQKYAPILIYSGYNALDASLVADKKRFLRPDWVIQCKDNLNLWDENDIVKAERLHNCMQPLKGTIVLLGPFATERSTYKQDSGISSFNVGFNSSGLKSVIAYLLEK